MTAQLDLSGFSERTISIDKSMKDFRPWNHLILDWEIEYQGYSRKDDEGAEGYIDFHVIVEIREAVVEARDPKTHKKLKKTGYKLTIIQNIAFPGKEWESLIAYEESFRMDQLRKAFDAFQRELLNIQCWVDIAESRARIIPQKNDVFECFHCGWVTDILDDDITCPGCGKRYWSERVWDPQHTKAKKTSNL
jgi:hypothetical protein